VTTHPRDLEIEQDEAFERRSFTVQRTGWIVLTVIVAAAAAGLLGSGPLGKATAHAPGAFTIKYERLSRYQAPQTLQIHLEPAVTGRREVRVWINRVFLDASKIESVIPPPVRVEGGADRLYYVFHMARPGDRLFVALHLQAAQIGLVNGRVGVDGGTEVAFRQLVYP
jgi:hypothetical protein